MSMGFARNWAMLVFTHHTTHIHHSYAALTLSKHAHYAQVVYLQLMWEQQSRINACKGHNDEKKRGEERWHDTMASKVLHKTHWRKSSQWASFTRAHASIITADTKVVESFRWQCMVNDGLCVYGVVYGSCCCRSFGIQ